MAEKKLTGPVMTTYVVRFRDGTSHTVESKNIDFGEHGVTFTGLKGSQAKVLVAFVPYGDLRLIEALV